MAPAYSPLDVYKILLRQFGPQGWWPVTPRGQEHPVYRPDRYAVLSDTERLEISVGAILTQNTAWSNVEKAIAALNRRGALDAQSLRRMPNPKLGRLIRSSGYFRQKTIKLKAFLETLYAEGGSLKRWLAGSLAEVRAGLLNVHGIGPETADSILLYAGNRPIFVIDAYTLRIGSRVGWFRENIPYHDAQTYFMKKLPRSTQTYQEFHALIVALAKFFCRKDPICIGCPLKGGCAYGLRFAH